VVWCGVVWCGVVWCGMVWCGVCGVVWYGVVCVVWCGAVWHSVVCSVCVWRGVVWRGATCGIVCTGQCPCGTTPGVVCAGHMRECWRRLMEGAHKGQASICWRARAAVRARADPGTSQLCRPANRAAPPVLYSPLRVRVRVRVKARTCQKSLTDVESSV